MHSKWTWLVAQFSRTLWVRATLFCVLAVVTALVGMGLDPFIPGDLSGVIGADAVDHILDILASSMLAVTTFSLTVMVSAYAAATSNVTPRAIRLLMQDTTTQNVLSTFLGSFLFSLVGIIALSAGAYGESGRVVLFVVTLGVIGLVVVTMLRWISHLSHFGRVADTTDRVEAATRRALQDRVARPFLGGHRLDLNADLDSAFPVVAQRVGYVQHVDAERLETCAGACNGHVAILALPGSFVYPGTVLARVRGPEDLHAHVADAFTVDDERSFDQDPRFGLCVLAEIASRALSPAVNDPGTAIDVLGRMVRVLSCWQAPPVGEPDGDVLYPHVSAPPLKVQDLIDDAFAPIARDGAALVQVQVRLLKSLGALVAMDREQFLAASRRLAQDCRVRAAESLVLGTEKDQVRDLVRQFH